MFSSFECNGPLLLTRCRSVDRFSLGPDQQVTLKESNYYIFDFEPSALFRKNINVHGLIAMSSAGILKLVGGCTRTEFREQAGQLEIGIEVLQKFSSYGSPQFSLISAFKCGLHPPRGSGSIRSFIK